MIKYNYTMIAEAYGDYKADYLRGFVQGAFETYALQETALVGICRNKNVLPKTNVPYVLLPEDPMNTSGKTVVLCDGTGIRDLEADLRYLNVLTTAMWEDPSIHERFSSVRKFATRAYVNWVGRALMNRFNINFQDKAYMDAVLAIYYYCACGIPKEYFGAGEYNAIRQISEATNLPAQRIVDVVKACELDTSEVPFVFSEAIECIRNISPDLNTKITTTAVFGVLARSWYGEGGTFYCNLAVEYPPMFMTLLYFALVSTDFKRTQLATVVKEFAVGRNVQMGDMYVKQFNAYIQGIEPKRM